MKPKFKLLVCSTVMLFAALSLPAQTQIVVDGIKYACVNDTASILGPSQDKPVGSLSLPASVNAGGTEYRVTSVSDYAFADCRQLTSVNFPSTLNSIGKSAFLNCLDLTSVMLPASLTSFGGGVFDKCTALTAINVDPGSVSFVSEGGVLYTGDRKSLILCPPGKSGGISVNQNTLEIKNSAFYNCKLINSVDMSACTSFISIGQVAFAGCTGLANIIFPASLKVIGTNAFNGCTSLMVADFSGCPVIEYIGLEAFAFCENLQNINIAPANAYYTSENGILYSKDMRYLMSVPGGKSDPVTISSAVRRIDDYAFSSCGDLHTIDLSACSNLLSVGTNAFEGCSSLTSVLFPPSLVSIGAQAFNGCSVLQSIDLPESLSTFGPSQFYQSPLVQTINVSPLNTSFTTEDGILYSKDMTKIIACPPAKSGDITTPVSVEVIDVAAFSYCENITAVDMSGSVALSLIQEGAFISDIGLKSIVLPESLKYIYTQAFSGCVNLTTVVVLGIKEPTFEAYAFGYTPEMRIVYVPNATSGFTASNWGSNAIIKYGDLPTGIEGNKIAEKTSYIGGNGFISINTESGTPYCIYNISGAQVFKGTTSSVETKIPVGVSGIYVVKAGSKAGKVFVH